MIGKWLADLGEGWWWLTMNDSGSSGVDVDDDEVEDDGSDDEHVDDGVLKLQNSMQGLLKRNIIYCIGNNYAAWQHMRWNEYIELCDRETHWEFFFARANLEWGDCHGGISPSKLQVYYRQRSNNFLAAVNDVGSSGDSLNISWIFLCIYCFLVVFWNFFLFITSSIGRYVFYLHWNMVCARVRRAPSFQHPTRQRQISVSISHNHCQPISKMMFTIEWWKHI